MKNRTLFLYISIIVAIVLSGLCGSIFLHPAKFCCISDFSQHIISRASCNNIDVSKYTNSYLSFLIFSFVSMILIFYGLKRSLVRMKCFYELIIAKTAIFSTLRIARFLKPLVICVASLIFVLVCLIAPISVICFGLCFVFMLVFSIDKKGSVRKTVPCFITTYALLHVVTFLIDCLALDVSVQMPDRFFVLIILASISALCTILYYKKQLIFYALSYYSVGLVSSFSFMLEIKNTCIYRNIHCSLSVFLVCTLILSFAIMFAFRRSIYTTIASGYKNAYYILSVLAFSWLSNIELFSPEVSLDIYETSNHATSICGALFFNQLPILDNFDAHMLSNSIPGLIHFLINKDYLQCLVSPYSYIYSVILAVSFYILASEFISKEVAGVLAITVNYAIFFSPSLGTPNVSAFMSGILLIVVFINWEKYQTLPYCVVLWSCIAASALFRLDVAIAWGVPVISLAIILLVRNKSWKRLRSFFIVGISLAAVIIVPSLVYILCNYSLHDWLSRFMSSVFSNQHWSRGAVSGSYVPTYYLVLPLFVLMFTLLSYYCINFSKTQIYILKILLMAYVVNSPRTVVRHNLMESTRYITSILVLISLLVIFRWLQATYLLTIEPPTEIDKGRRAPLVVSLIFVVYILLKINLIDYSFEHNESTLHDAIDLFSFDNSNSTITDESLLELYSTFKSLTELLLQKGETFFDFTNSTTLYSLLKLENPIYQNQSPMLINGDCGQYYAIEQLSAQKDNIPLVLMNACSDLSQSLDTVNNKDRHYLLYEYLLDNYAFLCSIDGVELWCVPSRYDEYLGLLIANGYTFDEVDRSDKHVLGHIPYLWANYDYGKDSTFSDDFTELIPCYLMVNMDANVESKTVITLHYDNNCTESYYLTAHQGMNSYKIRISNSYNWTSASLDSVDYYNEAIIEFSSRVVCD